MKGLLVSAFLLCALMVYAAAQGEKCGNKVCGTEQCCVRMLFDRRCADFGGENALCGLPTVCPCKKGHECVMFRCQSQGSTTSVSTIDEGSNSTTAGISGSDDQATPES